LLHNRLLLLLLLLLLLFQKFYFTEKVVGLQFLPYCTLYVTYPFMLTYPVAQPLQQITKEKLWVYAKNYQTTNWSK